MNTFAGIKITVTPDHPKLQLSARVCEILKPDFIEETNRWMRDFFGTTNALGDGQIVQQYGAAGIVDSCLMNPRTYAEFRRAVAEVAPRTGSDGRHIR